MLKSLTTSPSANLSSHSCNFLSSFLVLPPGAFQEAMQFTIRYLNIDTMSFESSILQGSYLQFLQQSFLSSLEVLIHPSHCLEVPSVPCNSFPNTKWSGTDTNFIVNCNFSRSYLFHTSAWNLDILTHFKFIIKVRLREFKRPK